MSLDLPFVLGQTFTGETDMDGLERKRTRERRLPMSWKVRKGREMCSESQSKWQERQDVLGVNCLKDSKGKIVIDGDKIPGIWKGYMEKLLNEENEWDNSTDCDE